MVAVIVILGVGLGAAVGGWIGSGLADLYARYFHFPVIEFRFDASVVLLALAISGGAALIGTLGAIRRAVRLAPAVAMRPEPPASYRPTAIERWVPRSLISPAGRMILRRIGRQPVKAMLSMVGIALSASVLVVGNFTADSIDYLMDFQFQELQRQDVSVAFVEPASSRALADIRHLTGVVQCEPFRSVSVRLRSGHRSRRVAIMGLEPDGVLYRPMDATGRPAPLPDRGLMLSSKLAELLAVRPGERVTRRGARRRATGPPGAGRVARRRLPGDHRLHGSHGPQPPVARGRLDLRRLPGRRRGSRGCPLLAAEERPPGRVRDREGGHGGELPQDHGREPARDAVDRRHLRRDHRVRGRLQQRRGSRWPSAAASWRPSGSSASPGRRSRSSCSASWPS